ncbi:MAG: hypothetical protein H7647_01950 [Candidatus Heimdallarchaeota archaeon]|nr:hypothetical protein [Candidatus Heimdallarchaeota archaeon]MCK4253191.1 hypothetical protein [Candidatus Heimdallarchaeota archaeon]
MRIKDKVYEEDWELTSLTALGSNFIAGAHHLFGALAISLIIVQSAFSLNIYIFAIWLVLGVVILMTDLLKGTQMKLSSEVTFGLFFIFGTILSLLLANPNSMFFPATLGRVDIIIYQSLAGLCIGLRFLSTFYYMEYFEQEHTFVRTKSKYTREQVQQYKDNLIKTDFEYMSPEGIKTLQKWVVLFKRMLWPILLLIIFAALAALYALMIFYLIPEDSLAEYIIRPSLILVAIIYSVLLIRTNAILPKIVDVDTQDNQQQEKNSDTEATEDNIENSN